MHPHLSLCTLDYPLMLRDGRAFTVRKPPGKVRKCMCGSDDHLVWKHLILLERCRGLRTTEGVTFVLTLSSVSIFVEGFTVINLNSPSWIGVGVCCDHASIQEALASLGQMIDGQQTNSQIEVVSPSVTLPILTLEDPHACMDRLEQRETSCPIHPALSSADHYFYVEAIMPVCLVGYAFESSFSKGHGRWIIEFIGTQASIAHFKLDLHCSYHQRPGHDTDHCNTLRHAIQDLIDQGDIHHIDLIENDCIHMLSWNDRLPEPMFCMTTVRLTGFHWVLRFPHRSVDPDGTPFWLTHSTPLVIGCRDTCVPITLWPEDDDLDGRDIHIVTRSGMITQLPPPTVRPFEGAASHESTHRDALIRALSQIRVETTTTPKGLIHMMTTDKATCIVFSDDDLLPEGLDHVRSLYITVGCSSHRVPSILLDNGLTLNVCPLATVIGLGFAPSDFGHFT
ncbi:hypothetical protein CK203_107791 [Vitis vinifera]|uniref:Uncharacterized protein n=1 Tax=Vitis vinifera TaxID=29760 RepID=A0A438CGD8_VITVI|nr:hypothetical protein CK203_107791 [Vitis vinifera]